MITPKDCHTIEKYVQKHYSQCGEAGILNRLIELVGTTNKVAVEFGGGDGYSLSNTRHLADDGWRVVMFDGAHENAQVMKRFITVDNINTLFAEQDVPIEFDVMSMDVDGNDYWLWKALDYRPRVVVAEFNGCIAPGEKKTIPYDESFKHDGTNYYGVSFDLLSDLARSKGYVPVFQLNSLNAFFVRSDLYRGKPVRVSFVQQHYHAPDPLGRSWVNGQ